MPLKTLSIKLLPLLFKKKSPLNIFREFNIFASILHTGQCKRVIPWGEQHKLDHALATNLRNPAALAKQKRENNAHTNIMRQKLWLYHLLEHNVPGVL